MTDLTEQWKKGELPDGHYYVRDGKKIKRKKGFILMLVKLIDSIINGIGFALGIVIIVLTIHFIDWVMR